MRSSARHATREISYAHSAKSRGGRALIRVVENATGRIRLIRRAAGYEHEVAQGANFWNVMTERYGLSLDVVGGSLENLPTVRPAYCDREPSVRNFGWSDVGPYPEPDAGRFSHPGASRVSTG